MANFTAHDLATLRAGLALLDRAVKSGKPLDVEVQWLATHGGQRAPMTPQEIDLLTKKLTTIFVRE